MPEVDKDKLPHRKVSPGQFERAAKVAGWKSKTIELFLRQPKIHEYVKVGGEMLMLVDV